MLAGCEQDGYVAKKHVVHKKLISTKKAVVKYVVVHDTICIAAVGDIMLGSSYPDISKLPPDSAKGSFMPAVKYFEGADVVFGNLEGTLLDTGMPAARKKKLDSAYLFRMPTQYGKVLKDAGFNLLSLANNHITDFDKNGYESTVKTLDAYGINYAGLDIYPHTVFTRNGIKYGFCAFAPNAHTLPLLDLNIAGHIIHDLKQQCDILIVSFHGGAEGASYEHVPFKMESYLNAKRGDVHVFAHAAIDSGADIVLGNGPHVSRAMEKYKGRLIAYSLGNFCTYKSVSVIGVCGMAPLLKVYLNKKGEFISGNIISFRQTHARGLMLDTLNGAVKRIQLLTEIDFPESGLSIDDDGSINVVD
ncbi:CapA family protein [Mucilaginibacter sp. McL0603]|uniref:CapA family protein n=1 Tax=Mucilaginibacter sp. McL0603 TaxID=3415670 RepID=UPI003CEB7C1A